MLIIDKNATGTNKLTLSNLKSWMKVETTDDDTLITSLITQSRDIIEGYLNMSLVETEITGYTDKYEFRLPYSPIIELISVESSEGGETLSYDLTKDYITIFDRLSYDVIKFIYKAGIDNIDEGLLMAWMQICSYLYEYRGDEGDLFNFIHNNSNLNRYKKLNYL